MICSCGHSARWPPSTTVENLRLGRLGSGVRLTIRGLDTRIRYSTSDSMMPAMMANSRSRNRAPRKVTMKMPRSEWLETKMCLIAAKSIRPQATMNRMPAIAAVGR